MTVAQLRTIAKLVFEAELTPDRQIILVRYTSGFYRLRFMDMNGNVLNYKVYPDGTHEYAPIDL